jgi:hypothetical protein
LYETIAANKAYTTINETRKNKAGCHQRLNEKIITHRVAETYKGGEATAKAISVLKSSSSSNRAAVADD